MGSLSKGLIYALLEELRDSRGEQHPDTLDAMASYLAGSQKYMGIEDMRKEWDRTLRNRQNLQSFEIAKGRLKWAELKKELERELRRPQLITIRQTLRSIEQKVNAYTKESVDVSEGLAVLKMAEDCIRNLIC